MASVHSRSQRGHLHSKARALGRASTRSNERLGLRGAVLWGAHRPPEPEPDPELEPEPEPAALLLRHSLPSVTLSSSLRITRPRLPGSPRTQATAAAAPQAMPPQGRSLLPHAPAVTSPQRLRLTYQCRRGAGNGCGAEARRPREAGVCARMASAAGRRRRSTPSDAHRTLPRGSQAPSPLRHLAGVQAKGEKKQTALRADSRDP